MNSAYFIGIMLTNLQQIRKYGGILPAVDYANIENL